MKLEGSCHCGSIHFSLESPHPYPYNRCYCSVCRKTQGGGGFVVNIGGRYETLAVEGAEHISVYRAKDERGPEGLSSLHRHFCKKCGSGLWCYDPRWPDLVHPFASAIDTPLPTPPEFVHLMEEFKAPWCRAEGTEADKHFPGYPDESLEAWHKRHGLEC